MFDPASVKVFRFTSCSFDEASGIAVFSYAFDDDHFFSETFVFPVPDEPLDVERRDAVDRALFLLSLAAGVSYYKAAVAPVASIESGTINEDELNYIKQLYFEGLGEFSYVNQISLVDRPVWQAQMSSVPEPPSLELQRRSLVAVGGGKDSCVSIELLKERDEDIVLASINEAKPIKACIKAAGLPSISVSRSLSPALLELNREGALNGHVPATAIVSLALTVAALIIDCDSVVMSNERSASTGNLVWDGREVNHQYSKSFQAELALSSLLRHSVAANFDCYSLLRPFSELDIARRFTETDRYDGAFTSCNRAFRMEEKRRADSWCCDCDKCRFVFLALATNASPKRMKKIFGSDLLNDASQIAGFEALCGWNSAKPFECVGEVEESIAAFLILSRSPEWFDHAVVTHFRENVIPQMDLPEDITTRPFTASEEHQLPDRLADLAGEPIAAR